MSSNKSKNSNSRPIPSTSNESDSTPAPPVNSGSLRHDLLSLMTSLGFPGSDGQVKTAKSNKSAKPAVEAAESKSSNKNTVKNKEKRSKQREAAKFAASDSALREAENRVKREAQKYAEENAKKFKEISHSNEKSGMKWFQRPEARFDSNDFSEAAISFEFENKVKINLMKAENLLKAHTDKLLADADKKATQSPASDEGWMKNVLSSGTLADRVAAMTLIIQQNPIGRVAMLERLIQMAQKKGKRESQLAIDSLRDLFISDLIPSNRALRSFSSHLYFRSAANKKSFEVDAAGALKMSEPATAPTEMELIFWLFEDRVKHWFAAFLQVLESNTHDPMSHVKQAALQSLIALLTGVCERERQVLSLIVNKLGDPDRKIGSKVISLLGELLRSNPGLKIPVIRELEQLIYRPNCPPRAQYFSIIFCNQIIFTKGEDADVAKKLIEIYFKQFKTLIKMGENNPDNNEKSKSKPNEKEVISESLRNRFLGALLTGVNRALPFTGSDLSEFHTELELLFSLIHTASWSTGLQSLMLLFQIANSTSSLATEKFISRYFRVLYSQLLEPQLIQHSKKQSALFLNLLFKSMKFDTNFTRVCAFVRRLFDISLHSQPNFVAGILILVSEIIKLKPAVKMMAQQSENAFVKDDKKEVAEGEPAEVEQRFDPNHRTPEYSRANESCAWELNLLLSHFHPSIASFADKEVQASPVIYDGDPLVDFTAMAFLDRFAFKNPKKIDPKQDKQILARRAQRRSMAMAASSFSGQEIENVREEDLFLYQYFNEKSRKTGDVKSQPAETEEEFANRIIMKEMEKIAGKADIDEEIDEEWDDKVDDEEEEDEDAEADGTNAADGDDGAWGEQFESSDEEAEEGEDNNAEDEEQSEEEDMDDDEVSGESDDSGSNSDDFEGLLKGSAPTASRGRGRDSAAVFASADEFSSILNDTVDAENSKERRKINEWQTKQQGFQSKRPRQGNFNGNRKKMKK